MKKDLIYKLKRKVCVFIQWVRFGKVVAVVVDRIDNTVCEIKYTGRFNCVVGYWAYGYFDPKLPYKGQTC